MKAKALADYGGFTKGDIIEVEPHNPIIDDTRGKGGYYIKGREHDGLNFFLLSELEFIPTGPPAVGAGGPVGATSMRTFDTGATRSAEADKLDYDGFLSPLVLERYAQYLNKHRVQADGKLRDSDNWQKGMPKSAYMKSAWRHFISLWKFHRGYVGET